MTKEDLLKIEIKKLEECLEICEEFLSDVDVPGTTISKYYSKKNEIFNRLDDYIQIFQIKDKT